MITMNMNGMMIPYFDLPIDKRIVKSVMIGPVTSSRDESAEKNKEIVSGFIHEHFSQQVTVDISGIPVRY